MSLLASQAQAIDTVSLEIVAGGDVGAYLIDARFSNDVEAQLDLVVLDRRGSATGWAVSFASGMNLINVGEPMVLAGQRIVTAGPLFDTLQSTPMQQPRIIIWADRGAGSGNYGQRLNVQLVAHSQAFLVTITVGLAP